MTEFGGCRLEIGDQRIDIGDQRIDIGNFRIETGDCRIEIVAWKQSHSATDGATVKVGMVQP